MALVSDGTHTNNPSIIQALDVEAESPATATNVTTSEAKTVSRTTFYVTVIILAVLVIVFATKAMNNNASNNINDGFNGGGTSIFTLGPTYVPIAYSTTNTPTNGPITSSPTNTPVTMTPTDYPSMKPTYCVSEECISIAEEILSSIDSNVDPCDNFYEYVCGDWRSDNEYQLFDKTVHHLLATEPNKVFERVVLDELKYYTDPDFVNQPSIQHLTTFIDLCLTNADPLTSNTEINALLTDFMINVRFNNNSFDINNQSNWNNEMKSNFSKALVWMLQRDLTTLFKMKVANIKTPEFIQDFWTWSRVFKYSNHYLPWKNNYDKYAVPFLRDLLGYSQQQINDISTGLFGAGGLVW
eukprot:CAMPEP_0114685112 /NCGR_PEP_ID=MMETSP0191-20121206/60055_1 /TAXON_ID=126664 /ORGANISM="Sorites sp." /LENGTH=354 /DNA_ID=CAMNT_0001969075 /DNA_START=28 /DNA_END=1089 /DNA_ORIENTATION=-